MLFNIFVIALVAAIVYFHFLQGLFSATLSAIFAIIAALVAVSFHETVVDLLLKGKLADQAHAMILVALFAAVYLILRVLFDQLVPGNVRFPVLVDKIGAPVMGLIAAFFGVGILVLAAQMLPMGPSIAQYRRFPMEFEKQAKIKVPGKQGQDAVYDVMDSKAFLADDAQRLIIPVDDIVLGLTARVSDRDGSLSAGRPLLDVHPDYLQELFGQRVGLQSGSKHTAFGSKSQVVGNVFTTSELQQVDPESAPVEGGCIGVRPVGQGKQKDLAPRKPQKGYHFLIVRVHFSRDDADPKMSVVAFSPASIRLVANRTNYYPIGSYEAGTLFLSQPDDMQFITQDYSADMVFEVRDEDVLADPKATEKDRKIARGVFVEVKRLARFDLGDTRVLDVAQLEPAENMGIMRKVAVSVPLPKEATVETREFNEGSGCIQASADLGLGLAVDTNDSEGKGSRGGMDYALKNRRFIKLQVVPQSTIMVLGKGEASVNAFSEPDNMKMVQVALRPRGDLPNKWAWADNLRAIILVDSTGKVYEPQGVIAKVKNRTGQEFMVAQYDVDKPARSVSGEKDMAPTDITLLYLIPSNTNIKALMVVGADGKREVLQPLQFSAQ